MNTNLTLGTFNGILLFLGSTILFIIIRRLLYVDMIRVLLKLTHNAETAHKIHFVLVFPGVFLHEFSHFLALRLMGVSCQLHLGVEMQSDFVVYGHVDFYERDVNAIKHFVSGIAPLISGLVVISLIAVNLMGVPSIRTIIGSGGNIDLSSIWLQAGTWVFWIAFYLVFAIASEMIPSPSDRRYWLHLGVIMAILLVLSIVTKSTGWLLTTIYPYFDGILKMIGITFLICLIIELILFIPTRLIIWLRE